MLSVDLSNAKVLLVEDGIHVCQLLLSGFGSFGDKVFMFTMRMTT